MLPLIDWDYVRDVFNTALETPAGGRDAYLSQACGCGTGLRQQVDSLLEAYGAAGDFFDDLGQVTGVADAIPSLDPGFRLADRFTVVRLIGHGGSGYVYEAADSELHESVALKLLRSGSVDEEYWNQFREEVRLARHISSPNVCRVYDVGRHWINAGTELLFLTMELVRGRTLSQLLHEDGPPSGDAAFEFIRQMAGGLAAAHRAGVVHGDFKSSNVMVSDGPSPHVYLMDFGLARYIGAKSALVGGTPAYIAPEQVTGSPATVATDIYSFGVVAFELLTGVLPFSGANGSEIACARLAAAAPPVRSLRPGLDVFWDRLIARCLEPQSERRFATVARIEEELTRWKRAGITRRRAMVGAVLGLAGGAAAWKAVTARARGRGQNTVAVLPFEVSGGDADVGAMLSEQLTSTLSKVPGMRVVAPASVAPFAGRAPRLAAIGAELNVRSVLSGRVHETAGETKITAQLAEVSTGRLLWSEGFGVRSQDVRVAHETIARAVIRTLAFQLRPEQSEMLRLRYATTEAAYRAYLLGTHFATKRDGASLLESLRYLKQAVAADGKWAVAWGALADVYGLIASKGVLPAAEAYRLAGQLGRQALAIDEQVPEAHLALACVAEDWAWAWQEAEQHYRRAAVLDSGSSETRIRLAGFLSIVCRFDEALAESRAAVDMDPLSIHVAAYNATHLYRARQFPAAVEKLEWILRRQPAYVNAQLRLCDCYVVTGRAADAVPLARTAVDRTERAGYALATLGECLALTGQRADALAIAQELEQLYGQQKAAPGYISHVFRGLRDFDAAFAWLERSLADHDSEITTLKSDPVNDVLRSDPRYGRLIADIGMS
jgi:TolB-like protein/tetratricopeptide (TPR) repeat protein